jgi:hypothetical protein
MSVVVDSVCDPDDMIALELMAKHKMLCRPDRREWNNADRTLAGMIHSTNEGWLTVVWKVPLTVTIER